MFTGLRKENGQSYRMPCEITLYHCPEDQDMIQLLGRKANAQQMKNSGFSQKVQPWKDICKNNYHYVARDTTTGIVCGWLTASLQTFHSEIYMLLAEISTRRIRNELYGGVGQALHAALLRDARRLGAKFVYLYPLTSEVREVYQRPEWGYVELRPHIEFLFHILTGPPSKRWLAEFTRPDPIEQAMNLAKRDSALRKQIELLTPVLRSHPQIVKDLCEELDAMEGNELSNSERKQELRTFFSDRILEYL